MVQLVCNRTCDLLYMEVGLLAECLLNGAACV